MFEHLVQDVSSRSGLGEVRANDLIRAVTARLLHNPQGGFAPLLVTVRDTGKADLVAAWLGEDPKAGAISPEEAESILGADWVDETSRSLGLSRDEVRIGAAVALPSVAHEMTPDGMIPAADELERGYAGWAGGQVSVGEAPIAGFPDDPSPIDPHARRTEMDLSLPAPEIKAKAFDGIATLLPWAALFVALPLLSVLTCNFKPTASEGHGTEVHGASPTEHGPGEGQGEVSHGEGQSSPTDVPGATERSPAETARENAGAEPNAHGDAGAGSGDAATGNTAAVPEGNAPIQSQPSELPTGRRPGDSGTGTNAPETTNVPSTNAPATNAP